LKQKGKNGRAKMEPKSERAEWELERKLLPLQYPHISLIIMVGF